MQFDILGKTTLEQCPVELKRWEQAYIIDCWN